MKKNRPRIKRPKWRGHKRCDYECERRRYLRRYPRKTSHRPWQVSQAMRENTTLDIQCYGLRCLGSLDYYVCCQRLVSFLLSSLPSLPLLSPSLVCCETKERHCTVHILLSSPTPYLLRKKASHHSTAETSEAKGNGTHTLSISFCLLLVFKTYTSCGRKGKGPKNKMYRHRIIPTPLSLTAFYLCLRLCTVVVVLGLLWWNKWVGFNCTIAECSEVSNCPFPSRSNLVASLSLSLSLTHTHTHTHRHTRPRPTTSENNTKTNPNNNTVASRLGNLFGKRRSQFLRSMGYFPIRCNPRANWPFQRRKQEIFLRNRHFKTNKRWHKRASGDVKWLRTGYGKWRKWIKWEY